MQTKKFVLLLLGKHTNHQGTRNKIDKKNRANKICKEESLAKKNLAKRILSWQIICIFF